MRALVIFAALLYSVPASAETAPWQTAAIADITTEPKVVEALFPNDSTASFWVSVHDDGTPRDGFAQYLCTSLTFAGKPESVRTVVRVLSASDMARGKSTVLGKTDC